MSLTIPILLAVISSMFAAIGQLGLKFGSMNLTKDIPSLMKNYALLAGLFAYGMSSIVFIIALRGSELTLLYPIAALNYVWVNLLSIKYLKEKMNFYKWLGILIIIIGVAVIV